MFKKQKQSINETGLEKTFYEAQSVDEALKIYFQNDDHLYGHVKNKGIQKILRNIYHDHWNSLQVLEIGAGGGVWTEFFLEQGAKVTCVDTCEPILEANATLHPEATCILGDATSIQIDEAFDLVFAKDVIEHIPDDENFLANMNRHLKTGGLILINTQNSFSLNYLIQGGYHYLRGNRDWCGWDPTHVRFYNARSLRQKLTQAGFEPVKWFGSYYLPYRLISGRVGGKKLEHNILHPIEMLGLETVYPLSICAWNIGVLGKKISPISAITKGQPNG